MAQFDFTDLLTPSYMPVASPNTSLEDRQQALLKILGVTRPAVPLPVPEAETKAQRIAAIIATLGQAVANLGGAKRGVPVQSGPSPLLMELLRRRREREQIQVENANRKAEAGYESQQRAAGLEYAANEKELERKARAQEKAWERQQDLSIATERNAVTERIAKLESSTQKDVASMRGEAQIAAAAQREDRQAARDAEDKALKRQVEAEQREGVKNAKLYMSTLAGTFADEIKKGTTPDQIRKRMIRAIDIIGLDADRQKQVLDYWNQEYEPELKALTTGQPTVPGGKSLVGEALGGLIEGFTMSDIKPKN